MPTYISLLRLTQKGIESIEEGPARLDRAKQEFRAAGVELKAFYLVSGRYDAVVISEAPNFETVTRLSFATGAGGNIRTESMQAFTEEEHRKIIATLP